MLVSASGPGQETFTLCPVRGSRVRIPPRVLRVIITQNQKRGEWKSYFKKPTIFLEQCLFQLIPVFHVIVAQLVELLVFTQEVGSSSLSGHTKTTLGSSLGCMKGSQAR